MDSLSLPTVSEIEAKNFHARTGFLRRSSPPPRHQPSVYDSIPHASAVPTPDESKQAKQAAKEAEQAKQAKLFLANTVDFWIKRVAEGGSRSLCLSLDHIEGLTLEHANEFLAVMRSRGYTVNPTRDLETLDYMPTISMPAPASR